MRALYWLRHDLRSHDNAALSWLAQHADPLSEVAALFPAPLRFELFSSLRREFLDASLGDLSARLPIFRSELSAPNAIEQVCLSRRGAEALTHLVYTKSHSDLETRDEQTVERLAGRFGVTTVPIDQSTLLEEMQLPVAVRDLPRVFTAFRKAVEAVSPEGDVLKLARPPHITDEALHRIPWGYLSDLGMCRVQANRGISGRFQGGETAALSRLHDFVRAGGPIDTYRETRNGLIEFDDSSKLSPWMANGSLGLRSIAAAVREHEALHGPNESTRWYVLELLWRDFFKFCARRDGAKLFQRDGLQRPGHFRIDGGEPEFQAWCQGETGQDFVDANMRELLHTGWMSNRGRQNAASYLAKTLRVDWRKGAEHFEAHLIDYDPESNWGNWAYLAGVGADPRDRVFNCAKQAQDYDPDGAYRRLWLDLGTRTDQDRQGETTPDLDSTRRSRRPAGRSSSS